jgi:hypothetical protein
MEYKKETIEKVEEFFSKRFPEKNLDFEKKCGYFYTWCKRFESDSPTDYMDKISQAVFEEMEK